MHSCSPWLHETGAGANSLSYRGYTPALVDQQKPDFEGVALIRGLLRIQQYLQIHNQ